MSGASRFWESIKREVAAGDAAVARRAAGAHSYSFGEYEAAANQFMRNEGRRPTMPELEALARERYETLAIRRLGQRRAGIAAAAAAAIVTLVVVILVVRGRGEAAPPQARRVNRTGRLRRA